MCLWCACSVCVTYASVPFRNWRLGKILERMRPRLEIETWGVDDSRLLGCVWLLMVLTLMPLRSLGASSRCRRLLDWLFVHIFMVGVIVGTAIAFTGRIVTFVTELDRLGGDGFTLAVVERVFHELRFATHNNPTRRYFFETICLLLVRVSEESAQT